MGDTWDDDDFEPTVQPTSLAVNRWEGEDEEEDVKDCWDDDEEEEKKDEEKKEEKALPPPPKSKAKRLAEKLAEKEKAALQESEEDILDGVGLNKEEILRRRKLQEESDLKVALETFGVTTENNCAGLGLDSFNPNTKQEFDDFQNALVEKISQHREKEEFPEFVCGLVKNICLHLNSQTLKNLKANVENLYLEKQKLEKGDKSKKAGKGKSKAKLNVESNISHMTKYGYENDYGNDYDDFM